MRNRPAWRDRLRHLFGATTVLALLALLAVSPQPKLVRVAAQSQNQEGLVEAGGLRPVDAGPLRRARQLEHAGFLHMALQQPLGTNFGSALRFAS